MRVTLKVKIGEDGSNDVFSPTCHMRATTEDRGEVIQSADYEIIDMAASSLGVFT